MAFLGVDTSNYTTSAALYDTERGCIAESRRLLTVEDGQLGLRQSSALFEHVKNLPEIIESTCVCGEKIEAVGVSNAPRETEDSYMPCFLAGVVSASSAAAVLGVKVYRFSHQAGHIAAACASANRLDLFSKEFIAFHLSGGTTEALLVCPSEKTVISCRKIAGSLDLKMGQAVDRVGNMLGFPFPSGRALDELSLSGSLLHKPSVVLRGADCSLSGLENKCRTFFENGESGADVARYLFEYLGTVLLRMYREIISKHGDLPVIFSGGVAANTVIRKMIGDSAIFADPHFSSDNALGPAVLASFMARGDYN